MSFENRREFDKSAWGPWRMATQHMRKAIVEFKHSSDNDDPIQHVLEDNVEYEDATAVSSLVDPKVARYYSSENVEEDLHHPCLDIDVPHVYVPSSNPDHGHLILTGITMNTEKYLQFLQTLADFGVLEQGFVNVAKHRKQSWLRMPWIQKAGRELYKP